MSDFVFVWLASAEVLPFFRFLLVLAVFDQARPVACCSNMATKGLSARGSTPRKKTSAVQAQQSRAHKLMKIQVHRNQFLNKINKRFVFFGCQCCFFN